MKTPTLSTNCIHRSLGRSALILFPLLIGCFGLLPKARAVSPAPDGGYPGGNTAEGQAALLSLTSGGFNTGVGFLALRNNATNSFNTAVGAGALLANTSDDNTATGAGALLSNTTGFHNTADGAFALFSNTMGSANTAIGNEALFHNTTGANNIAIGADGPLASNIGGNGNLAIGTNALANNSAGNGNVALGNDAGFNIGTANGVICIGTAVYGQDVSNTTWIGNVYGVTTLSGCTLPVIISCDGQLGTQSSSCRFKKNIKSMDHTSESILALKPVTFNYKSDKTNTPQFGLIAEDAARVNPNLVVRDKNGEIYAVRYEAVNAMLLNEFLKEHRKVEEQQATIAQLKWDSAEEKKQIATLTAGLQKVSAQVEMSHPAPRMAVNDQ